MKILCMRHGEALPKDVDAQRPLSERGVSEVQKIADHLARCGIEISHAMHSHKLRAQQTAQIMSNTLDIKDVHDLGESLAEQADIGSIVEDIETWTEDTLIVGHLPYLHELVAALVTPLATHLPITSFPPGAVMCLDYYEAKRWIIKWHLIPNIIPNSH